ncbi:MAG: nitrate/nitrite sensor protein NarQ [Betaproteobacteria bacterium ADurb.Bin341]|nr:MAG: nitrate/nitrite sensor protein NarQ [Betaproteobacteria bacterium ADurb.Bin341]
MFRKISVKVTVFVNLILFIVIAAGTTYIVRQESARLEEQHLSQAKLMAAVGAKSVAKILEEGVNNNAVSLDDLFDATYIPIPNFEPPKYHTKFDTFTDKVMVDLYDEFLKNPNVVYAVAVDKNGYVPTHNTKYQRPITGDKEKDKVGNRAKIKFADPVGIKAAENRIEGFVQVYQRNTGETLWDVSSPIYVKGKMWGNFRFGLSIEEITQAKTNLLYSLVSVMAIVLVVSFFTIMLIVNAILRPLTHFTEAASKLADGDVNIRIEVTTNDEIGELGKVLERMRVSLQVAMERLRRK